MHPQIPKLGCPLNQLHMLPQNTYNIGWGRGGLEKGLGYVLDRENPQPVWQAGLQKEHLSGCSGGVLVSIHT